MDAQQLVAIYNEPQESPDSGVVCSDSKLTLSLFAYSRCFLFSNICFVIAGSIVGNVRDLNIEVPPSAEESMVELNVVKGRLPLTILFNCSSTNVFVTETEVGISQGDIPIIEPPGNDNIIAIAPVVANEELVQIDENEVVHDILTGEAPNAPAQIQDAVDDLPLLVSEDYEVVNPVSEPHVGLPLTPHLNAAMLT